MKAPRGPKSRRAISGAREHRVAVGWQPCHRLDRAHRAQHRDNVHLRQEHRRTREEVRPRAHQRRAEIRIARFALKRRAQHLTVERNAGAFAVHAFSERAGVIGERDLVESRHAASVLARVPAMLSKSKHRLTDRMTAATINALSA